MDKIHITNGSLRVQDIFLHLYHTIIHMSNTIITTSCSLTFIMFPFSLRILDRMVGVSVEASFFFEIHQVEPVLSFKVIVTVLTIVIQVEEVVEQEKVVCRVLASKVNRR